MTKKAATTATTPIASKAIGWLFIGDATNAMIAIARNVLGSHSLEPALRIVPKLSRTAAVAVRAEFVLDVGLRNHRASSIKWAESSKSTEAPTPTIPIITMTKPAIAKTPPGLPGDEIAEPVAMPMSAPTKLTAKLTQANRNADDRISDGVLRSCLPRYQDSSVWLLGTKVSSAASFLIPVPLQDGLSPAPCFPNFVSCANAKPNAHNGRDQPVTGFPGFVVEAQVRINAEWIDRESNE
jgi:hypothetical protein